MDIPTTTHNDLFELAEGFINNSNQPVFLTGKAGTGKTTFLKHIIKHSVKNCAVVAPTGVAAINAGGATIHSFFQLPFTPYLPQGAFEQHTLATNEPHNLMASMRLSQKRREVLQQLELLIIDEISMVRADVLDAMDNVLRHVRSRRRQPFGGVQVLYIGDLYQLPPVVKDEEWILLKNYYENPFFFSSKVMAEQPPVYIELKKVYRQHDSHFIQILNQVRNNDMDEAGYNLLHERLNKRPANEGVITLTTHNATADQLNNSALGLIKDKEFVYRANVDGDFSERIFPTEEYLRLKKGTQVMFLKNNTEKGYYNGKIGTISNLEEDKIVVNCKDADGEKEIEVQKETWRNVKYTVDEKRVKLRKK
ncbi:MAG: AAA family ATPase [Chitinophagaceae bacterium]|nr:AAA family ATPase [Chitinophagaceae bacterium]